MLILGYFNLFIPLSQITARAGIGMTTLLTLVSMYNGVRKSTPEVSYVSYLDMWMMICLLCVLSFMFEFILITYVIASEQCFEESCENFEKWLKRLFPLAFLVCAGLFWGIIFAINVNI